MESPRVLLSVGCFQGGENRPKSPSAEGPRGWREGSSVLGAPADGELAAGHGARSAIPTAGRCGAGGAVGGGQAKGRFGIVARGWGDFPLPWQGPLASFGGCPKEKHDGAG